MTLAVLRSGRGARDLRIKRVCCRIEHIPLQLELRTVYVEN